MNFLTWIIVAVFAFAGGFVQTVSGFGGAIVMMLAFPYFFPLKQAPALASAIGLGVSGSLMVTFFKKIDWKKCLVPTIIYTALSQITIFLIPYMNVNLMGVIYGVFLIFIALWYFFAAGKVSLKGTFGMLFSTFVSGIACGLFGIGGPLMAVYYSDIIADKTTYLATIQFNFFFGNLISFISRIINGIYTVDLVKYTLFGFVFIWLGRQAGLKVLGKIDREALKKFIYVIVAASGVFSIFKYI